MTYLIGIDIGTSSTKTVLVDETGRLLSWAGQEYPIEMPKADWSEQQPAVWLKAALSTLRQVMQRTEVDLRQVAGIGLAGQMHSMVCLGADGKALRPAILWADRRSSAQVQQLAEKIGLEQLGNWTGNPLAVGFMLPSWMWLREHEPELCAATRTLLLPKDEVRYRLIGRLGSDPSDASSTSLFDPHTRRWSEPMLQMAGLSLEQLPPVDDSAQVAGGLLAEMAVTGGLLEGTPVVFGGSDQSMQALGQGLVEPGMISCTIGTGGQLFAPLSRPVHDSRLRLHLFCHALPGRWHLLAAILSAGLALRWLRDQLWPGSSYQELANAAAEVEAATQGLFFLPYLAGERTPHMDPQASGAFLGLRLNHGRAHLVRAVMEGVVFALRQGLDLMVEMGTPVERLLAAGGATRHPLWLQLQADIFGRPVYPGQAQEATACGAALLAGIGTGVYRNAEDAIRKAVRPPGEPVWPEPKRSERYQEAYQQFCRFYPALLEARQ